MIGFFNSTSRGAGVAEVRVLGNFTTSRRQRPDEVLEKGGDVSGCYKIGDVEIRPPKAAGFVSRPGAGRPLHLILDGFLVFHVGGLFRERLNRDYRAGFEDPL